MAVSTLDLKRSTSSKEAMWDSGDEVAIFAGDRSLFDTP